MSKIRLRRIPWSEIWINIDMVVKLEGTADLAGNDKTIIYFADGSYEVLEKCIVDVVEWLEG